MPTNLLLTSHHPDFDEVAADFVLMDDAFKGQRHVKTKGTVYLPFTAGMILDGAQQSVNSLGYQRYLGYLERAKFPNYVETAVGTLVGVLNRENAKIDLPPAMEPMRENATRRGESLDMLLRRVHAHQLQFGRIALLADALRGRTTPILVDYRADTLINWDDEPFDTLDPHMLRMAVLDESRPELQGMIWVDVPRARALILTDDTDPSLDPVSNPDDGRVLTLTRTYRTFTENGGLINPGRSPVIEPRLGGRALPFIPLTVIGATDLALPPGVIPLLGLGNLCMAIYRQEADFRHGLHLQGQDTLVIIGHEGGGEDPDAEESDDQVRVGAGSQIMVAQGGDAKFIGVSAAGLSEQRQAIDSDKREAQETGARLLNPQGAQAESGEALRIRISASTATLTLLAKTAAFGVQTALRQCAIWMNADPAAVVVTPNLNFSEVRAEPRSVGDLMDAKAKGAPISLRSVHTYEAKTGLTEMSYDEEIAEIEGETPLVEPPAPDSATPSGSDTPTPAA